MASLGWYIILFGWWCYWHSGNPSDSSSLQWKTSSVTNPSQHCIHLSQRRWLTNQQFQAPLWEFNTGLYNELRFDAQDQTWSLIQVKLILDFWVIPSLPNKKGGTIRRKNNTHKHCQRQETLWRTIKGVGWFFRKTSQEQSGHWILKVFEGRKVD